MAGRLFKPFVTTKTTGLGLGLSIVAAHGSRIDAKNAREGGAIFSVTFPAATAA